MSWKSSTALMLAVFLGCAAYPAVSGVPAQEELDSTSLNSTKALPPLPMASFAAPEPSDSDYIVGAGDTLKVAVWDHDDLTRLVQVSEEGSFSYPLIGRVRADGLPISQIEEEMTRRLDGRYLINPQVTILVEEYKSKRVFVLGEVGGPQGKGKGPGAYPLTGRTSLIELLSMAGGLAPDAGTEIIVVRPSSEAKTGPMLPDQSNAAKVFRLNMKKLLRGDPAQNIQLEDGDTVYVPPAHYFYVFGQVKNPGRFVLEPETTVLKAITMAGGLTEIAAVKKTRIVREENGVRTERAAELTQGVSPQDIIVVPESFF